MARGRAPGWFIVSSSHTGKRTGSNDDDKWDDRDASCPSQMLHCRVSGSTQFFLTGDGKVKSMLCIANLDDTEVHTCGNLIAKIITSVPGNAIITIRTKRIHQ